MVEVTWTFRAVSDFQQIAEYISKDSTSYASGVVERIFSIEEYLKTNPWQGRMVPEFRQKNIREVIVGNYRIVYRISSQYIEVLTVHHGARILKKGHIK